MSPISKRNSLNKKKSESFVQIILDLKMKGLSLNEIRSHITLCYDKIFSIRKIREIIIDYGKKARKINQFSDNLILPHIEVAEVDEIYQGRAGMYVGVVDKKSTYLVSLTQLNSKDSEEFITYFSGFQDSLSSLIVWITDGLPTYNSSLDSTFPDVPHLLCHVHAYRDIMKEQEIYNRRANRRYTLLVKLRKKRRNINSHLNHNRNVLETAKWDLNRLLYERDMFYKRNNLALYSKTKKFTKIRSKYKKEINVARSMVRSYQKQVDHWTNKLNSNDFELKTSNDKYKDAKITALQSGRLVKEFKALLDCKWFQFETKEVRLKKIYSKSKYPIAKKLLKLINNKKKLFSDKVKVIQARIPPNRANTNTIESIFGRYRLFFRKYRKMKDTNFSTAIFEILRLYHNLSPPFTGINKERSPIIRAGIKTKYFHALDCLYGGFS